MVSAIPLPKHAAISAPESVLLCVGPRSVGPGLSQSQEQPNASIVTGGLLSALMCAFPSPWGLKDGQHSAQSDRDERALRLQLPLLWHDCSSTGRSRAWGHLGMLPD